MPSRFEYERAVRASTLPPLSRLLALTIATWADVRTGVIPARLMPSLTTLEGGTGMARGSVRTHLDNLEAKGWLLRNRPTVAAARSEKARTQYKIRIPKGAVVPDSDGIELGQELTKTRAGDALVESELGQELPQARAGAALELGQEMTPSRAGAALSSSNGPKTSVEYQQTGWGEPTRVGDRPRIPDASQPLVDALYNAGLITGWDLKSGEWLLIEALIKRCGIPALVVSARGSWQGARTQPRNGNYFIPAWRKLATAPAPNQTQDYLPAAVGEVVQFPDPGHRPSTTDARVNQAIETGRRLQALADAQRAQENQ